MSVLLRDMRKVGVMSGLFGVGLVGGMILRPKRTDSSTAALDEAKLEELHKRIEPDCLECR